MAAIDTLCPECDARLLVAPGQPLPACAACGKPFPGRGPAPAPDAAPSTCAVCGGSGFYVQKDFNQNLGCLIFLAGAALAPWTRYLSLVAGSALDLVLYLVLPTATICYTCRSVYRGYPRNPAHGAYDPNTAWERRPRAGPWEHKTRVPPPKAAPPGAAQA